MTTKEQDQVLQDSKENARKASAELQGEIVRRLAEVTQTRAAVCMGVHGSTVSRMVAEDLEKFTLLLAALDLKVVAQDCIVTTQEELHFLKVGAYKYLKADIERDRMLSQRGHGA